MPVAETWLLPDGVADVLPKHAARLEHLRRHLLDTLAVRGYQLVYTPFIEYVESLLIADNSDLDLVTFKLIDQLSGRLMGVRADITPQVARIDAHVNPVTGTARYCYAATVLHTRPQGLSESRAPLQLGAELFGSSDLSADLEMVDLMLTTLAAAGHTQKLHLDLGHVEIFRALSQFASLDAEQESTLFDIYQRKALPELADYSQSLPCGADFLALGRVGHDLDALSAAFSAEVLAQPLLQHALSQLTDALAHVRSHWADCEVSVDAAELRGYHYHTGLVFAAYAPNLAMPLAQGGRYDGIGTAFGRTRPATGFSCDLHVLARPDTAPTPVRVIAAPQGRQADLQAAIAALRQAGDIVIQALANDQVCDARVTHQLMQQADGWHIVPCAAN